jgi:hypothetical protein
MSESKRGQPRIRQLLAGIVVSTPLLLGSTFVSAADSAAPSKAEPSKAAPQMSAKQKEFMDARQEMQRIQQRLGKIEQDALKANPELQKQREDFRQLLLSTMKKNGHDPQKQVDHLRELQTKLKDKDLEDGKRKELIDEFRSGNRELQQAQREAFQDEDVQKARVKLAQSMVAAMKEQDGDTEQLIRRLKQVQQHLQEIMRSASPKAPAPAQK